MISYDMIWCNEMWYDVMWSDVMRYDMMRCDGLEVRICIQASMCHCITIEGGSFGEKELYIYNLKVGTVEKNSFSFNF